jgi:inorganic phosphate transporter, PiT family
MMFIFVVIMAALIFELINGFHDAANSIATVVATKVLTPNQGILIAAVFELLGALTGTAVATTIGKGLVDIHFVTLTTIFCGLMGGIIWNLLTWWLGLPSSSSHALMGGLCGAAIASAGDWNVVKFEGMRNKVLIPMITSPLAGFFIAFTAMGFLLFFLRAFRPMTINRTFGKLQIVAAAFMGFSHGTNDAQKTMGVIALTLFTATNSGAFTDLPIQFSFLSTPKFEVATWIKIVCALTMACGTAMGGWRIIKTLGKSMVRLQPIHGFAAQTTAATVIAVASHFGMPISTTHTITTSIMGVGATKRLSAVKWSVVSRIVVAWLLTLPISGAIAYSMLRILHLFGVD